MIKKKVIILGGGLAGLSTAWHLKQKGIKSVIFEKESSVGGLCRSKQVKGFVFDYDGHLLHFRNNYTLKLVKKLLGKNLIKHKRSAWINSFGIFSQYPFQANLYALPKQIASECLWGYIHATNRRVSGAQLNFMEWINSTFGNGIARHFMVPYNQKFWTIPLNQMTCSWSDKFIPQLNLVDVVNGFFANTEKNFGYNAVFWYPEKGGIDQLPRVFEKQIGEVHKGCCVSRIDLKKKEITINGKDRLGFDALVATIPLPEMAKIIKPLPASLLGNFKKLRWNSIFNLNLGLEGSCQGNKHWVYFPHKGVSFFRVGFFHNFSDYLAPRGKSSLYVEVSYSKNKPINKRRIVRQIVNDLRGAGIISKKNRILVSDINDIKYGYPIYDQNYSSATGLIREFLLSNNIITCGRYGWWKYMSMEDTILDGKRTAEIIRSKMPERGKLSEDLILGKT